ncbi:MAG TPA: hypothetical protein VGM75_28680 [Pseudonocardiaceae bacterium]
MIISADGEQARNVAAVQHQDVQNLAASARKLAAGTGTAADQATVMDGSAANLVSSAGGGFQLDPASAKALAVSCGESVKILNSVQQHLTTVAHQPSLGSLPGVSQIASFTQSVAADPQGIVRAVASLRSTLTQMQSAYEKASADYEQTEHDVAGAMKNFQLPSDK